MRNIVCCTAYLAYKLNVREIAIMSQKKNTASLDALELKLSLILEC